MAKCWLDRKVILVTGASSGIGRELVKFLINKHNCMVIGVGRNEEKLKSLKNELEEKSHNFSYKIMDVGVEENWKNLSLGISNLDVIINNAGVLPNFSNFENFVKDECENGVEKEVGKVMNTNFMSAVYSVAYLSKTIEKSQTPAIINVCSSAGLCPLPGISLYTASKSALKNFTESLRCERKYYIGLVCPGFTKTDIFRNQKNSSDSKLISLISTSLGKMSKKIYKGIKKKKKRMVFGMDAKAMDRLYRLMPKSSLKLFTGILKKANIELFKDVF
ncbi:MAG: SDR family oxidoreductase [Clostridiales bacterium]|nr:SDR family oxidoreductase [Clostridiales bacterium]